MELKETIYASLRATFIIANSTLHLINSPLSNILGPLLFLIYLNDLPNVPTLLDLLIFADDTNLIFWDHHITIFFDIVIMNCQRLGRGS